MKSVSLWIYKSYATVFCVCCCYFTVVVVVIFVFHFVRLESTRTVRETVAKTTCTYSFQFIVNSLKWCAFVACTIWSAPNLEMEFSSLRSIVLLFDVTMKPNGNQQWSIPLNENIWAFLLWIRERDRCHRTRWFDSRLYVLDAYWQIQKINNCSNLDWRKFHANF